MAPLGYVNTREGKLHTCTNYLLDCHCYSDIRPSCSYLSPRTLFGPISAPHHVLGVLGVRENSVGRRQITVCASIITGFVFCRFRIFADFAFLNSRMLYTAVFKHSRVKCSWISHSHAIFTFWCPVMVWYGLHFFYEYVDPLRSLCTVLSGFFLRSGFPCSGCHGLGQTFSSSDTLPRLGIKKEGMHTLQPAGAKNMVAKGLGRQENGARW